VFARFKGEDVDLSRPLLENGPLQIFTSKSPEALEVIRHDAAHVVASVVQRLFPGTQVTIGPSIEDGFYYDFSRDQAFTPEDLEKIETAANEEIGKNLPFVRKEVPYEEARALFEKMGEKFKVEIIDDIHRRGAKTLTLYSHGDWVDFCLGPHSPSTGKIRRGEDPHVERRVLAGRSPQPDAPARLRHGVLRQEGTRRAPQAPGRGEAARPPQAGQGAGPLSLPPLRARLRVLDAQRHRALQRPLRLDAAADAGMGLRRDQDPAALQQGALGDLRPLGQIQRETCSSSSTARRRSTTSRSSR